MIRGVSASMLLVVLVTATAASRAEAAEVPTIEARESPYELSLGIDIPLVLGALAFSGVPALLGSDVTLQPACGDCDPLTVNALDRGVVGNRSSAAQMGSDIGLYSSLAMPFAFSLIDQLISPAPDGWAGTGKDMAVLAETLALSYGVTAALKSIVARPRPLSYDPSWSIDDRSSADASHSFPSGHTSMAFAAATAYSMTFMKRHPKSPWIIPMWVGTEAVAAAVGVLRTEAGKHFWTDVLAGAGVGIAAGLIIPWLHSRKGDAVAKNDASGTGTGLTPVIGAGSVGLRFDW
jgi:hypothetical protein